MTETALQLANTDWLLHRLEITGPSVDRTEFAWMAAGAGIIPWRLDLDRIEEDLFLRLAAPTPPQVRTLSLDGARIFARQLRDAVARRHGIAVARVGRSRACAFDLHSLAPVPPEILALGPCDPASEAWLWANWGTGQALRHVTVVDGQEGMTVRFWSADWTPWRALERIARLWPRLRFDCQPVYDIA